MVIIFEGKDELETDVKFGGAIVILKKDVEEFKKAMAELLEKYKI